MKKICTFAAVLAVILLFTGTSFATGLLAEDFNYTVGTLLTTHGWAVSSGTGGIAVTSPGLTYPGYLGSGVGLAATVNNVTSEDDNLPFTPTVNSGTVYASAMINITTASATNTYFFHFGSGTSGFVAKVFAKADGTDGYDLGISKAANTAVNFTSKLLYGSTNLIVIKYTYVAGTTNDPVDLFLNPTPGGSEPSPTISAADLTGADFAHIDGIYLRQASGIPTAIVDGIRVGTTWEDVTPSSAPALWAVPDNITGLTYITGAGPSVGQSYTLNGANLTGAPGNITVTAPTNFEVSTTLGGTYSASLSVPYSSSSLSASVFVRLKSGLAIAAYGPSDVTNAGGGATTLNVPVSGSVEATTQLNVSASTITGLTYSVNHGPSATGTYNLSGSSLIPASGNITITAPTNFEVSLSSGSGFSSSITKSYTGGALSSTPIYVRLVSGLSAGNYGPADVTNAGGSATTENVAVSGFVTAPVVTLSTTTLSGYSYVLGSGPSYEQSFNIICSNLYPASGNISISAPTDYEVSATTGTGFGSSVSISYTAGTLARTYVYVRLKAGLALGTYNAETIAVSGGDAASQNVTCSGYVGTSPSVSEDFAYTVGTALVGQGGWAQTGTVATNPVTITTPGLNATGEAVTLTTGQDVNLQFTAVNSGVIYASALVKVTTGSTGGDYFIHFGDAGSFNFYGRTYAKTSGAGIVFGFGKTNETAVYGTTVYDLNTTYKLVLKYTFVDGLTNDYASLFINPADGVSEPAADIVSPSTGNDMPGICGINLRQGSSSAPTVVVDGIKVGQTWAEVNPAAGCTLSLTALFEAMYVAGGTAMLLPVDATVELHDASTLAVVESKTATLSTAGVGSFLFTSAVNGTPYYIAVKSGNSVETWSANTVSFTGGALSYNFTTGTDKAYTDGSNPSEPNYGGVFCIYSGDVNQDGYVTADDYTGVDNDNTNFDFHVVNDVNGDGYVTADDYTFIDNNNTLFVQRQVPPGAPSMVKPLLRTVKSPVIKKSSVK